MALKLIEFFGFAPLDSRADRFIEERRCPFTEYGCIKPDHGGCSAKQVNSDPIIFCPNRLYADNFSTLRQLSSELFGQDLNVMSVDDALDARRRGAFTNDVIIIFGKGWGGELALPKPKTAQGKSAGSYYIDYVMARVDSDLKVVEFVAVEVQTIDTTGSYLDQVDSFKNGQSYLGNGEKGYSKAGFNWENVNKRILPQLIYKGHVLRRESLCKKGLFFVCPIQVYEKAFERVGNHLHEYDIGNGTITFLAYDLNKRIDSDGKRGIQRVKSFTTTVDQLAQAFVSPANLPEKNVYQAAIERVFSE